EDLETQEKLWRANEAKVVVAHRREKVDERLGKIQEALDADAQGKSKLPLCSRQALSGYPQPPRLMTIDAAVLGPDAAPREREWDFLTSPYLGPALGVGASDLRSQLRAVEELEKLKVAAVLNETAIALAPQLPGDSAHFEGGAYLGRVYLADVSEG